ncbi:MAG: RNase adapter RapZ, partial [Desulfovibrionaceae bacterium]
FDLRFLPNPYFIEGLRALSGKNRKVAEYVYTEPASKEFLHKMVEFLQCMLPLMEAEGRYRTTIAVGCTGGRHRSVATVEYLGRVLRQSDYVVSVEHRHLELG